MPAPETTGSPDANGARMRFQWEGMDRHKQLQRGELVAGDVALARALLRRQGVKVTHIRSATVARARRALQSVAGANANTNTHRTWRDRLLTRRIPEKQIVLFARQLATMLQAGLPLLQALDISIRGAATTPMAPLLRAIRADVAQGNSLHTALTRHPQHFDGLFCNLVRAAEQAGLLDVMLDRIAGYREKSLALKGKLRSALAYPCAVVVVALLVTTVIMLWVVPSFEQMFHNFGAELPLPTRIVVEASRLLGRFWPLVLGGGALFGVAVVHGWRRSIRLRELAERASLRLPLFGSLLRQAAIARWSRTFGTLLGAGVPLLDTLETVAGAAGNVVYANASRAVREAARNGASLHAAMQAGGAFPDLAVQLVAVGEETGTLDAMLGKLAELNEREVDDAVAALTSLMEPIIMAVLGILIGGLVIAMYLPVFRMGSVV